LALGVRVGFFCAFVRVFSGSFLSVLISHTDYFLSNYDTVRAPAPVQRCEDAGPKPRSGQTRSPSFYPVRSARIGLPLNRRLRHAFRGRTDGFSPYFVIENCRRQAGLPGMQRPSRAVPP
jgi:hypothetical protein